MTEQRSDQHAIVAGWLAESTRAVAFTGAGVSTESGIPDFRSPGGVWSQSQPVYFDEFLRSGEARFEYWRQKAISHQDFERAEPNAGHRTLAAWQARGRLRAVITQNIDGLHQQAGSTEVLELHGTAREIACLECRQRYPADPFVRQFLDERRVPPCPNCGGLLKHATISFGQTLDEQVLARAQRYAAEADLLLALGSSLVVYPAAMLPQIAQRSGARLVIINRDPTGQDELADAVIHAAIGPTLLAIDRCLEATSDPGKNSDAVGRPSWHFLARDEQDTRRLGAALAAVLPPGTTVALIGTLGAGKTRLVQAIAAACGLPAERVVSPTFVLCQPYEGTRTLYHLDAYRLKDDDEFLELGPEEYFESEGLTLIEWADRVAACLPPDRLEIRIDVAGPEERRFEITALGPQSANVPQELSRLLDE